MQIDDHCLINEVTVNHVLELEFCIDKIRVTRKCLRVLNITVQRCNVQIHWSPFDDALWYALESSLINASLEAQLFTL